MKPNPRYHQTDLFESEARLLQILPSLQEELINLLSELLWQVASAQTVVDQGGNDEQDSA